VSHRCPAGNKYFLKFIFIMSMFENIQA
jgi:hypothetical protein